MSIQVFPREQQSRTQQAAEARKYRIAVFNNVPSGGARRAVYDYMRVLAEDGHTLDLFDCSTSCNGVLPLDGFATKVFYAALDDNTECGIRLPFVSGYVEAAEKFRRLGSLREIGREIAGKIDGGNYDVAFIHHCHVTQAPYLLRYLKTPSVFYSGDPPRGLYEPHIERDYESARRSTFARLRDAWYKPANWLSTSLYDLALKRIYERNMDHVDVLMANSYYSLETFYKLHGIRAHVVYPGIDTDEFAPLGLKRENIVLSVGGIEPIKGHDFVIKSLARVSTSVRPQLHIVANRGYGIEKRYLISLAEELDVSLVFDLNVSSERLVELYSKAKLTLCGAVMEPFGLTPLESMACGTAVVAVREGGPRESVAHDEVGYLVERDTVSFAEAVEALLSCDDCRETFGRRAREYILGYWTLDRVKRDLLELFDHAIQRRAKRPA